MSAVSFDLGLLSFCKDNSFFSHIIYASFLQEKTALPGSVQERGFFIRFLPRR